MAEKDKPIRCLLDATALPPSAFALPDDGRQRTHLCNRRKAVVQALASKANADGTSCFPSISTLVSMTEIKRSTLFRFLDDLRTLGILTDADLHPYLKTRRRELRLPVPSSNDSSVAPVPSSQVTCPIFESAPVPSSSTPVPSSTVTCPIFTPTLTALDVPPTEPPKTTDRQPDRHSENGGQAVRQVDCSSKPFSPKSKGKTEQQRWLEFVNDKKAALPDTMKHATPTDEQRTAVLAQLDAIVVEGYALRSGMTKAEFLGSAISDWEQTQSPPLRTLDYGRWKRWLETGDPNS